MYLTSFFDKISELTIPTTIGDSFIASMMLRYNSIHDKIIDQFGTDGIYIIAFFCGFLCLIAMIYIKSIIETFQSPANGFYSSTSLLTQGSSSESTQEDENTDDNNHKRPKAIRSTELEELNYKPLRSSPIKIKNNKNQADKDKETSLDIIRAAQAEVSASQKEKQEDVYQAEKDKYEAEQKAEKLLSAAQKKNAEMITLLLNLLGRGVSETKTAQVLYIRDTQNRTPEDIIQIVKSVRDFIGLCKSDAFKKLPAQETLPSEYEALNALANGDNSLCLILLKNLTRQCLNNADNQTGFMQNLSYAKAANYACLAGNFAELDDHNLAHNSYTLASELSPQQHGKSLICLSKRFRYRRQSSLCLTNSQCPITSC